MKLLKHPISTLVTGLLLAAGCKSAQTTPASSGTGAAERPAPRVASAARGQDSAGPAAPGDSTRTRRRPDPRQQEAARLRIVSEILTQIAGREHEPASRVFKNVQLMKDVPAGDFVRSMNEAYARPLGMLCGSCHVPGEWNKDDKKNKKIARDMQRMVSRINSEVLPKITLLDEEYEKVACATCHRGSGHIENKMPVPPAPATTAPAGAPPGKR